MKKVIVYTDGGSRGNPGLAGAGVVITDKKGHVLKKVAERLGEKTNNWAEYEAVIIAFRELKKLFGKEVPNLEIKVKMDSQLVQQQLSGQYQIKEESLQPQFIKNWNMRVKSFPNVTFTYIPREENKVADGLANEAMDGKKQGKIFS
jgi:ribonuclease HI